MDKQAVLNEARNMAGQVQAALKQPERKEK
jgi:hypothetical protein